MSGSILVVDDEPRIVEALARLLKLEGYAVDGAFDGEAALDRVGRAAYDAVLLDLDMPRLDGIGTLRRLRELGHEMPVVMVSGRGTIARAVEAIRLGAHDFVEKPVDDGRLLLTLERALELTQLRTRAARENEDASVRIVAESPALKATLELLPRLAASASPVLVTGETGTGKEVIARRLHELSPRSDGPFIRVNCAALPSELAESELFGHVRGAFTGASRDRKGRFQLAHGGTLFLDEIGELGLPLQAKLLRALGEGEFEPVGSEKTLKADVRVVAATNRALEKDVAEKRFRDDLYYRLAILLVKLAPLRDRREEIAPLARHFLFASGRPAWSFAPDAIAELESYRWPGNIRELRNIIERLAVTSSGATIAAEEVRSALGVVAAPKVELSDAMEAEEARLLREALEKAGGNVSAAARALGLERSHLHKKLRRHGFR